MLRVVLSTLIFLIGQAYQPIVVTHLESIGYPAVARDARIQGTVEITAEIAPDGRVISAYANSGHPALKPAAEENVKRWKFAPARNKRELSIVFEFALEEPNMPFGSETKNYFDLPSKVRVVTNFRSRTD